MWKKRGLGHGLPYGLGHGLPYGLPVVDFLKLVSAWVWTKRGLGHGLPYGLNTTFGQLSYERVIIIKDVPQISAR